MFCTYCGKQNPENIEFCVHCGKKIGTNKGTVIPKPRAIPFARKYGAWAVIIAGGLILLGFVLPWASFNISIIGGQSYSALTGLFALIIGFFGALVGASSIYSETGSGAGGALIFVALLALIPMILILIFGILHLRNGFRMRKLSKEVADSFNNYGHLLKGRSVACLVFLGIYFLVALGLSSFHLSGLLSSLVGSLFSGTFLGIGFWLTTIGYVIAFVIGLNLITDDVPVKDKDSE